ncbi:polysaccharide biosynthesis tyrosine autokinase [Rhodococcus sp. BP-349]|uniref:polysaccharide biosynthesis tyrosine autokinase n=1 Tax=unclassified Rhodococcus (in: high G+C Gram-positive bacteria) TaxID=192944 RepID=UPI001C9BAA91|nr:MULTISPECIES: polysaccharide biosynthesis tyrosine autokinase [unclassified Rhodococcus (in: high G+C Gram-positive bacteria)]MBY6537512.1 polysaccharide biosynthesis tyrosine autokinase [Rhodococcus sp. BP-363]MBY6541849.1 polysaccharide biosynthesis tyrosine autokinase [Rhodococcus sp. BP-369]MBY6561079.1 polysaccharide biosynthesis tyrosine autokinase [Rhodococcus sp. BP-370]MBY6575371.1 polysaccharide biosynthesis tyrosine autokinase [Rhodococcus sp. BP-364]MBY6584672.1 polysaccharide b
MSLVATAAPRQPYLLGVDVDISEYLRIIRSRWLVILIALVSGTVAAVVYVVSTEPTYEACTTLYVSTESSASSVAEAYQGNLASQQRVSSYAELLRGEAVARRALEASGDPMAPRDLASNVRTSSSPDTVLVAACVSDTDAGRAARHANALAQAFVGFVDELETPPGGGTPIAQVRVVEPASVPETPVSPRIVPIIGLGVGLGLLLGLVLAVVRERLDRTVKTRDRLGEVTGVPVIGAVPFDASVGENVARSGVHPSAAWTESLREVRTNLQFLAVDTTPRALVITSTVPSEGKTTTAVNLSLALAEAGHRVVLVEADLRRPRVVKYLGLVESVGLSTVLAGRADISEVLQATSFEGVDVMASGPLPPNPSELLGSETFRATLRTLKDMYDYVIVDAPPLLPVTDAAVASVLADGALVVVRHGKTRVDEVQRGLASLARVGAPALGTVLTMVPVRGRQDSEYRHYYDPEPGAAHQTSFVVTPHPASPVTANDEASRARGASAPDRPRTQRHSRSVAPEEPVPSRSTMRASPDTSRRSALLRGRGPTRPT